jgi:hypothetical protein
MVLLCVTTDGRWWYGRIGFGKSVIEKNWMFCLPEEYILCVKGKACGKDGIRNDMGLVM